MLYIAYFIILSGGNTKTNLQNFPFLTCRGWKTASCTYQMPLNHLQTATLKLFGGLWLRVDEPSGHCVGPLGRSSTLIVTK